MNNSRPRFKSSHSTRKIKLRASCNTRTQAPSPNWRDEEEDPKRDKKKRKKNR